jgi:HlyB family type I secretion system ABC transporter
MPDHEAEGSPALQDNDSESSPSSNTNHERVDTGREGGAAGGNGATQMRIEAISVCARYHGVDLDRSELKLVPGAEASPATLVQWARTGGLWAKADRLVWRNLMKLNSKAPVVLLFKDGSAGLLVGVNAERGVALVRDPRVSHNDPPVAVDELRLSQVWNGDVVLMRTQRGVVEEDRPFDVSWLIGIIAREKTLLRDIGVASVAMSVLTIIPALLVMQVVNRVMEHHSMSTLALIATILVIATLYETLLGYARRELILVVSARMDAKLNLHIFNRLLNLPLDYFERNQAGQISHKIFQVYKIRDFLTGKLLATVLDLITLVVLLPLLFYLDSTLTWFVLAISIVIAMVIFIFLNPTRRIMGKVIAAEIEKSVVMVETIHGIRTVKSLALEPQQKDAWDEKQAIAGRLRLEAGRLSNWPNTIVTPLEGLIGRGVIVVGAYLALVNNDTTQIGGLIAFMMLSNRVAAPLTGMARLLEDFEEVRLALGMVGSVINTQPETASVAKGLRPKFFGALEFDNLSYTYPGTKTPALNKVTFSVPAGTMLGIVGRSGSGKSTIMRLLQGISRDYEGYLKIDGTDLREINLPHLRRGFGVVLQDNFLFRGSIRENIIASRPGLVLEDAVRAARLAGAEEFIERMPQGYETFIQEGSPNLSGGQRQRLAIARALICDPRILILDEATSALDPESEALVNANLQRIASGRTMVIVSHRLSSLVDCDQILVLDKGGVMDMAPHEVLLERCATYRTLWQQQNRHVNAPKRREAAAPALAQGDD